MLPERRLPAVNLHPSSWSAFDDHLSFHPGAIAISFPRVKSWRSSLERRREEHHSPHHFRIDSSTFRYDAFPRPIDRSALVRGDRSGLITQPKHLLLDEPSLGLAPLIGQQVFQIIAGIRGQGTTVLLVEQNAHMALSIARSGLRA
jgi:hypothetical protein